MSKPASLLQGTLGLLILKILHLQPLTGWSISVRLRQMSNDSLQVSHGSLYPALHKLEHDGYITGAWTETPTGRPSKIYSLTAAGKKHLKLEAANWNKLSAAVNGILEST